MPGLLLIPQTGPTLDLRQENGPKSAKAGAHLGYKPGNCRTFAADNKVYTVPQE